MSLILFLPTIIFLSISDITFHFFLHQKPKVMSLIDRKIIVGDKI